MRWFVLLFAIAIGIPGLSSTGAFGQAALDRLPVKIQIQLGHASEVTSVALSHDGKFALSGSQDNTLKLWDSKSLDSSGI
jgi:WD40 repeat protein